MFTVPFLTYLQGDSNRWRNIPDSQNVYMYLVISLVSQLWNPLFCTGSFYSYEMRRPQGSSKHPCFLSLSFVSSVRLKPTRKQILVSHYMQCHILVHLAQWVYSWLLSRHTDQLPRSLSTPILCGCHFIGFCY